MLNPDGSKTCPSCQQSLHTDSFYKIGRKKGADCYGSYCRECTKTKALEWQRSNPEKMSDIWRRGHQSKLEKQKAGLIAPERVEREAAYLKEWRKKNKHKTAEYSRECKQRSRDADLARYRAANAISNNRKRSRKKGTPDDFTIEDWEKLTVVFEKHCAYCGASPLLLDLDHVVPMHRGGYNVVGNLVPACRVCNSHKTCLDPRQFAKEMDLDLRKIMTKAAVRISTFPTDDGKLLGTPV
jgi:5-methylcytosine-specific restriction endonuclease McrA